MKTEKMIQETTKLLSKVDVGGAKGDPTLAELDRGILQVALMVSGLDGTILPVEYVVFGEIAKKCRGVTQKDIKALYGEAIEKAALLAEMARVSIYTESDRLSAFVRMTTLVLPKGFGCGSLADLRRAFVLWIAMGAADGAFTDIERKAIKTLARRYALQRAAKAKRFTTLLESGFFAKAEKLIADMSVASRRAKAEAELRDLVTKVEFKEKGARVLRPANRISLVFSRPGPTINGWR